MVMYAIRFRPFENEALNRMEIFNEICILLVSYHLFLLTGFNEDYDCQYEVGWSLLGITSTNILVNMIYMLTLSLLIAYKYLKELLTKLYHKLKNPSLSKTKLHYLQMNSQA